MGELQVRGAHDEDVRRVFTRAILEEIEALEKMLERGLFESGVRRIGVEQEMFLVDASCRPAAVSGEVLKHLPEGHFTTELAQFNMEANLEPMMLDGATFQHLERRLDETLEQARAAAAEAGANVLLTGILPTLTVPDLSLDNITPQPRYELMNEALLALRGEEGIPIFIRGLDIFDVTADSVMFEAANTSYQLHLQVDPESFARFYNIAQLISAPLLACAVNSPLLCGHRLWRETRVALFERAVDERHQGSRKRGGTRPRVSFGDGWIDNLIDIFRDDIARFRPILARDVEEGPLEALERGELPELRALALHNGTVWRWNRACYGVHDGVAHLRIENRVLPSGPTVLDEVANAAFFYGMMLGMEQRYGDIASQIPFEEAKANFFRAARHGLQTRFRWLDGRDVSAHELILDELIPIASEALHEVGVSDDDLQRYLGVIEARTRSGRTGARWTLDALHTMRARLQPEAAACAVTIAMHRLQLTGAPVHTWTQSRLDDATHDGSYGTVRSVMTRSLFTVGPEDVVDLASSIMEWRHLRYVPVEDASGAVVGVVSAGALLRLHARHEDASPVPVRDIMDTEPVTVSADAPLLSAMRALLDSEAGYLLVVEEGRLVGIATERDFLTACYDILEDA